MPNLHSAGDSVKRLITYFKRAASGDLYILNRNSWPQLGENQTIFFANFKHTLQQQESRK